ncbi:hypothetical protein CRE_17063 [Caenorhabditis remanei]|uniref:DUF38 domain-containing protein n=1 Tax=Caenorhabditis remanei TaxID=31234 RepID=E3M9Y5_CAERE|nr:hypothetical protein CRE_17063 [Caenorhabditis remanei]
MSAVSKLWDELPNEMKLKVVGQLDIVGKIQLGRCSRSDYEIVDICKEPMNIIRIDLKIKNGFVRWAIVQTNGKMIQVDYTEKDGVCFIRYKKSTKSIPIRNPSALDQSLIDLCKILGGSHVTIEQFRLYITGDDDNFSAERAGSYFDVLVKRFGRLSHKLKIGKINIDYSSFTVYEEDMLRGLELLDPSIIYSVVIKGDEVGTILNTKNVMDCEAWKNSVHLICTPAIRPMEAFWDKTRVSTGLVVESLDFLPRLIKHLRVKTIFEQMVLTLSYFGEDPSGEELMDTLIAMCPESNYDSPVQHAYLRNYTLKREGYHMRVEISENKVKLFAVKNGEEEEEFVEMQA